VATRVVAEGLKPEVTAVSKVMTRNPTFVAGDTLAIEALDKMVQGKFRHLPVVEHGEVVALLDITKCLYDAIARMERAAEKGGAIAAAVKGVEQWGQNDIGKSSFIDTFWERIFRPTLGTLITDGKGWVLLNSIEDICWQAKIYIGNWRNGKLHGESDRCMVVVMQSCNSFTIWYCPDCNKADEGTTDEFSNYHFCQQQACGHSNVSTFFLLPCVMQLCTFKLLYKMKQASFWHSFDWTLWLQLKGCVAESCCSRSLSSNNKCGQGILCLNCSELEICVGLNILWLKFGVWYLRMAAGNDT
jgi:hypothetical protein